MVVTIQCVRASELCGLLANPSSQTRRGKGHQGCCAACQLLLPLRSAAVCFSNSTVCCLGRGPPLDVPLLVISHQLEPPGWQGRKAAGAQQRRDAAPSYIYCTFIPHIAAGDSPSLLLGEGGGWVQAYGLSLACPAAAATSLFAADAGQHRLIGFAPRLGWFLQGCIFEYVGGKKSAQGAT